MQSRYITLKGTADQMTAFQKRIKDVDSLVEKVEIALDMFPAKLHVDILLCDRPKGVQDIYRQRYNRACDYTAFISLGRQEVVLALSELSVKMLSHELGHAVVEQYFTERPPYHIHEMLAQYVEERV